MRNHKLPDCMMPDGAGPCIGYEQLSAAHAKLEKERDEAISQRNDWKRDFDYVYDERKSLRTRLNAAEEALITVRAAIIEQAPDTLWAGLIETAVDCIDAALAQKAEG